VKIYVDFSAYSDIAIGSARLFGIRVPENFDWPYLRVNIAEFWRHWHISLYRWLVDYVFIPLGGSRCSRPRVYLNVLITMFLSGLWHGAGLNFVVWGLWHGLLLTGHRLWTNWRRERVGRREEIRGLSASRAMVGQGNRFIPVLRPALLPAREREPLTALVAISAGSNSMTHPLAMTHNGSTLQRPAHEQPQSSGYSNNPNIPKSGNLPPPSPLPFRLLSWALTFILVNLGWAFFCMDLRTSLYFFRRLFIG